VLYAVIPTPQFQKDLKFYIKKRKFTNIDDDIDSIIQELGNGNLLGEAITDIKISSNNKTYKVRAANSNTKVGQSNGYRIIYYAITEDCEIYLLTIYYKKDDNRIPSKLEITEIINTYCE